jgi:hypothetical protein
MAIGLSGVTELNSYFNNIYEDALFAVRENTIATRLVRVFTDGNGDQTRSVTEYPTASPVSVAETEDFAAPTKFDKTLLSTLTPGEIMSQIILTDRRIETDPQNARQDAAITLSNGVADKIDGDILGNFNALTGGTVGSLGGTMLWGYLYAAISRMRANKIPRPYYCVMHPYAWHDLATVAAVAATVTNGPEFQDEVMRRFYVANVAGLDGIFLSANVETSGGTGAYGAIFNPNAIAYDIRRGMRLEPERDASKRAWELNMTAMYAHGVWRPKWGVQILHDITAPTS